MSTPITGDSGSKTPEGAAARQIFSKPPFRLFFNETKVPGRSDISTSHPLTFGKDVFHFGLVGLRFFYLPNIKIRLTRLGVVVEPTTK